MYTNYLLNNLPSLLKTEVIEDQSAFLGVKFNFGGHSWKAHVDGHRVNLYLDNDAKQRGLRNIKKSIFVVGKKAETNEKHAAEIVKYMNVILAYAGKPFVQV